MDNVIKKDRESNIELLRIVLMFMIIIHHLIMHGTLMTEVEFIKSNITDSRILRVVLNSFLICAVDCFIFITGYYGIKFKWNSLIKLLLQILFYSIVIRCMFIFIGHEKIGTGYILEMLAPIKEWWFLSTYILLYVFSPFINKLFINLKVNEQRNLVILLGIVVMFLGFSDSYPNIITVSRGYSLVNFIFIYILGRYIGLNKKKYELKKSLVGYILSCIAIAASVLFIWSYKSSIGAWKMYSYNDILVVISAVCLFFIFKNLKINSKIINWGSKSVLGIYMIHDHRLIRESIYEKIFKIKDYLDTPIFIPVLILMAIIIFIVCLLFDKIREYIMKPIENYVIKLKLIKKLLEKSEVKEK